MRSYCLTDIGKLRSMNQDFVYASQQPVGNLHNLFIVADGMGGHNAGDYASRCAVETMVDYISSAKEKKPVKLLNAAVQAANREVYKRSMADRSLAGMGTTLVACPVMGDSLYVVNVGDSRLYIVEDEIDQITKDHSLVEEMVRNGQLEKEDARNHPDKNVITRAIGMKDKVQTDLFDVGLNEKDRCLLCSDGLTNMVEDKEILRIIRESGSLEEAARELKDTANRNGGSDNISVILIEPIEGGV